MNIYYKNKIINLKQKFKINNKMILKFLNQILFQIKI